MSFMTTQDPEADPLRGQWVGLDDPRPVVVSWGAGVQSTVIALLVERGELPRPAAWIFADTGGEPEAVYQHVERWAPRLEKLGGFHVVKHSKETLLAHVMRGGGGRIPFHAEGADGKRGPIPARGCTRDFKILPINRLSQQIGAGGTKLRGKKALAQTVTWQGISLDEVMRAKPDGRTCYPLLELRWSRVRCLALLRELDEPIVKSACVFCPFRSDALWASLSPADLAVAEAAEDGMRATMKGLGSVPSLHKSGVHVREKPWMAEGGEQIELIGGDCGQAVCFV